MQLQHRFRRIALSLEHQIESSNSLLSESDRGEIRFRLVGGPFAGSVAFRGPFWADKKSAVARCLGSVLQEVRVAQVQQLPRRKSAQLQIGRDALGRLKGKLVCAASRSCGTKPCKILEHLRHTAVRMIVSGRWRFGFHYRAHGRAHARFRSLAARSPQY